MAYISRTLKFFYEASVKTLFRFSDLFVFLSFFMDILFVESFLTQLQKAVKRCADRLLLRIKYAEDTVGIS